MIIAPEIFTIEDQTIMMADRHTVDELERMYEQQVKRTCDRGIHPHVLHGCARCKNEWEKRAILDGAMALRATGSTEGAIEYKLAIVARDTKRLEKLRALIDKAAVVLLTVALAVILFGVVALGVTFNNR